ncbi:histidine kinase [Polaribacter sp.]|uniref:sensor histidine kinase n=1 Tax=Polaribacter sp. TaxID=1920175 RepID=UPI003F6CAF75
MKKIILLFLIISCYSNSSFSQHPVFYQLTEKDGLPDVEFYQVLEDKKGFIWFAANKGLFRFDGKNYINFSHPNKRGLSVFNLALDKKGRVWCNNISGQYFYAENNRLNLYVDLEKESNGQLSPFYFINNHIVINSNSGFYKLNIDNKTNEKILDFNRKALASYVRNDTLFFIQNKKLLYSVDLKTYSQKTDLKALNEKYSFWNIGNYKNSFLLNVGSVEDNSIKTKTLELDNYSKKIKLFKNPDKVSVIKFKQKGDDLWVLTTKGFYIFKSTENQFQLQSHYFKNKRVTDVIKDSHENYWVTTLENGVFIIPNLHIKKTENRLNLAKIRNLHKIDKNNFAFGTIKGEIGFYNTKNNKHDLLKRLENRKSAAITGNEKEVYFCLGESNFILNTKTKKITNTSKFKNVKDFSYYKDSKLVATFSSFSKIIDLTNQTSTKLRNKRAYKSYYSKTKDEIYIAYIDGLAKYDSNLTEEFISFNNQPIFALDIAETKDGTIWVSTFKDGILGIKDGKVIENYTIRNGLLSNRTSTIKADKNSLWIVSEKGLQLFNTTTKTFKNLTKKEGITSYTIFDIVVFDEEVYFSSNDGLFKIDKQKAFKEEKLSDFYFSSVLINDRETPIKSSYTLSFNSKKIEFTFKTNGFLLEENLTYKYRLNRSTENNNWNTVNKSAKEITFNNLAPDNYVFELQSYSDVSKQKSNKKTINIEIKKPFYLSWWFILISISLAFSIILSLFYRRELKLKIKQKELLEKERLQKQLASSKLESLQSQMNPHFTFNALNSIQNLVLKGSKEDAYNYLTKFAELIRKNLNLSQKSFIYFEDELNLLKKYLDLEKLRFRDNFSFSIEVDSSVNEIEIPTMIIQPFVENAIKHGLLHKVNGERILELYFKQTEVLECTIIDNGVGLETSKKINKKNKTVTSFSTKSIKEKLKFLKDYYSMDIGFSYEEIEEGTKVIIKIPYK